MIDVGTNVLSDGSLVGDVDEASVRGIAGALTPVPGGVGSVTTSLLLLHTTEAAREQSRALVREPPCDPRQAPLLRLGPVVVFAPVQIHAIFTGAKAVSCQFFTGAKAVSCQWATGRP